MSSIKVQTFSLLLLLIVYVTETGANNQQEGVGKPKVLITHPDIPKSALLMLKDKFELRISKNAENSESPSREILLQDIKDVDAVLWFGHVKVDKEMIDAAGDKLKIVSSMGAGCDHISQEILKEKGIRLTNTPNILGNAVADMAVGLALAVSRNIVEGYKAVKEDKWVVNHPTWMCGPALDGATVGIVGFGDIGSKIAQRIKSFSIGELLYHTRNRKTPEEENGAKYEELDKLLEKSDFVFLTVPLNKETENLLDKKKFEMMKDTSILINSARGGVVNQEDLIEALDKGKIGGAALDVTTPEPLPLNSKLLTFTNVVVTPHISSATFKARQRMADMAAENIIKAFSGV